MDRHDAEEGQETDSSIGPKNSCRNNWSERRGHYVFTTGALTHGEPAEIREPEQRLCSLDKKWVKRDVSAASA